MEELDEYQYHKLLFQLGIATNNFEKKNEKDENQVNNKEEEGIKIN